MNSNEAKIRMLQGQIAAAVQSNRCTFAVRLGPGSEVTDLTLAVPLVVEEENGALRSFEVLRSSLVPSLLAVEPIYPLNRGLYSAGEPLILAASLSGDSVVRAVLWYRQLELLASGLPCNLRCMANRSIWKDLSLSISRSLDGYRQHYAALDVRLNEASRTLDLTKNAQVVVARPDRPDVLITFVSGGAVGELLAIRRRDQLSQDLFTTGGPLVLATEICGDSIVRGVLLFLRQLGEIS